MTDASRILVGKPEKEEHLGVMCVGGKIILNWMLNKQVVSVYWIQLARNLVLLPAVMSTNEETIL
jgi:hypothetical protein